MLKNAYFATLRDYRLDVENCKFPSLKWGNHAKALYYTTFDINEDACIALRSELPDGTMADCMLFGCSKAGEPCAVYIMMGEGPFKCLEFPETDAAKLWGFAYSYNHFSGGAKAGDHGEGQLPMYFVDHQADLASTLEDLLNGGKGEEVCKAVNVSF